MADVDAECRAFLRIVDGLYGVYLDATLGFRRLLEYIDSTQAVASELLASHGPEVASVEHQDAQSWIYGLGNPNDPGAQVQHQTTTGEVKRRNRPGGGNYTFLANACVIALYSYWEDSFRGRIAEALGLKKSELKAPVMGDLRLLRNSIVHHRAIAKPEIADAERLRWLRPGEPIALSQRQMETIVNEIRAFIAGLCTAEA